MESSLNLSELTGMFVMFTARYIGMVEIFIAYNDCYMHQKDPQSSRANLNILLAQPSSMIVIKKSNQDG